MQAIMETLFDAAYLIGVISIGSAMIGNSRKNKQVFLFGTMAVLLGIGDAFHLIPRAYALWTSGLEANAAALGTGKFITSITMTIFYVILYHIWRARYDIKGKNELTLSIYALAAIRIVLCFFPQNRWLDYNSPISWGIYRNIPFAILGIAIIVLFYREAKRHNDTAYKFMWLAIVLSFALYIPVVLWSSIVPIIGILMIPKTLAYVWIIIMGYKKYKSSLPKKA